MTVLKFEDQRLPDLDDYAKLAEQFIPGRRAIFAIVEAALLELLAEGPAKILVVGAGGGEEILRLGQNNPQWSFVGVDTYQPMVELARRRLAETPLGARSRVETTAIDALDDTGFDAATCILTAHFVPDDGAKLAFLTAIHERMKPGAPLAIVDGVGVGGEDKTELLRRIWKRHAVCNGVAPEVAESNAENFKKVAVVSEEREEALLASAGFERLTPIFRGLAIKGWLAFA
ncbi:class I SAM-dependent methyltransferase [Hyphomicrobium sp.]|uniref:class I SAM-dependent methyltransferase n=1 Tax=Hyphomicrobium sp. TaxID=82 RepID=UPI002BC93964|nr:class I SAM-dependent methyltransferase [Hyphomicrobium sp.]HRN89106.1 class I SAM-dependent methyltransferase [Hyphomicrobium sp.]HRQ28298.1 class I SAM-dependent methyltransferase [Hyphomicrobium sp.]